MKPEKIDLLTVALQENNRYLTDDEICEIAENLGIGPDEAMEIIHPPKPKHRCEYKAPSRVWMKGENGLFTSREWMRGEKKWYSATVLGRDDV
jgi:hypothetical protein